MLHHPTVIVSDAHHGAVAEESAQAFRRFLARVPELGPDLLINGDLFDFWFEYRTVILRKHFRLLRRLAELVEAGVRIRLVSGNHDAWGGSFLRDELGIELLDGPLTVTLGGRRSLVAHGDGLGGGDLRYRLLRRVTRSRLGVAAFRRLHPDTSHHLVGWASGTADRQDGAVVTAHGRAEHLSAYAETLLDGDPNLQLVVFGHAHRPELRESRPGRFYLNAGDWIHHFSYAVVTVDRIELRRRDSERDGPLIDDEVLALVRSAERATED